MTLKGPFEYSQKNSSGLDHLYFLNSFLAPPICHLKLLFCPRPMALSDLPKNIFRSLRVFSGLPKAFSGLDSLQPVACMLPYTSRALCFHSPSILPGFYSDISKTSSDIHNAFSDRQFLFRFLKARSEPWKVLCSSQALSPLRKSCFRSRNVLPAAATGAAVAFNSEPGLSKAIQIRLRESCSVSAFSKRDKSTLFNSIEVPMIKCGILRRNLEKKIFRRAYFFRSGATLSREPK